MKRLTMLLVFIGLLGYGTQSYAQSSSLPSATMFGFPDTIAGYQVVTVETSDTIACMPPGVKNLILRSPRSTLDSFLSSKDSDLIGAALLDLNKNETDILNYQVIGAGVPLQDIENIFNDWDPQQRKGPCMQLSPVKSVLLSPSLGVNNPNLPGFSDFNDGDAGSYTDDNAQSVHLTAPLVTGALQLYDGVALLNNVWTDMNAFYQDGFAIANLGGGTQSGVVYAFSVNNSIPNALPLGIQYYPGNEYIFIITYTSGLWWMCAEDLNIPNHASYTCQHDTHTGVGTNLAPNVNTSVWLELATTNGNWYNAFSGTQFYATSAKIYRNGFAQNWASESQTHLGCINPNGANPPHPTSGTLIGGGNGSFKLTDASLQC